MSVVERVIASGNIAPEIAERWRRFDSGTMELTADLFVVRLKMGENEIPEQEGFWRRSYVRALFALVEAKLFSMKWLVLEAHENGTTPLALGDEVLLREQAFAVDNKGELRTVPKFMTFEDSLKLTFRCHATVRNPKFVLDTVGGGWVAFKKAVEIRNRVTHPKTGTDVDITDEEMTDLEHAEDWFEEMVGRTIFPNSTLTMPEQRKLTWSLIAKNADHWSSIFGCTPEEVQEMMEERISKEEAVLRARTPKQVRVK